MRKALVMSLFSLGAVPAMPSYEVITPGSACQASALALGGDVDAVYLAGSILLINRASSAKTVTLDALVRFWT